MPTIFTLEESNITVSGGGQLSGITQGDGSHLVGLTITLNNNAWEAVDILDNDNDFADNDSSQTLDGDRTYDGVLYDDGRRVEAEFSFIVTEPGGQQFQLLAFNINEPGVTSFATVEGLAFVGGVGGFPPIGVPLTVISAAEGPSEAFVDLATPPCFTAGTRIDTPNGPRPIETLSVGDLVTTLDGGPQPIKWIGTTRLPAAALRADPKLVPVCITAGALGQGLPQSDLRVSRQHRVVVSSRIAERMFNASTVLIPAHKLTALPGIYSDDETGGIEYVHVLLDRHHIIFAEGAPTESLFTGPEALKAISPEARDEILTLFPELADHDHGTETAIPTAPGHKIEALVARHLKNGKPLLDTSFPTPS